jgi:hypothetical protein
LLRPKSITPATSTATSICCTVLAVCGSSAFGQNKFRGAISGLSKCGKVSDHRTVQSQTREPAFRGLIQSGLVTQWGAGVS